MEISRFLFKIIGAPIAMAVCYIALWETIGRSSNPLVQIILIICAAHLVYPLLAAVNGMFAEIPHLSPNDSVIRVIASWLGLWLLGLLSVPLVCFFIYFLLQEIMGIHFFASGFIAFTCAYVTYRLQFQYIEDKSQEFINKR